MRQRIAGTGTHSAKKHRQQVEDELRRRRTKGGGTRCERCQQATDSSSIPAACDQTHGICARSLPPAWPSPAEEGPSCPHDAGRAVGDHLGKRLCGMQQTIDREMVKWRSG
jgi:hypothetical protein